VKWPRNSERDSEIAAERILDTSSFRTCGCRWVHRAWNTPRLAVAGKARAARRSRPDRRGSTSSAVRGEAQLGDRIELTESEAASTFGTVSQPPQPGGGPNIRTGGTARTSPRNRRMNLLQAKSTAVLDRPGTVKPNVRLHSANARSLPQAPLPFDPRQRRYFAELVGPPLPQDYCRIVVEDDCAALRRRLTEADQRIERQNCWVLELIYRGIDTSRAEGLLKQMQATREAIHRQLLQCRARRRGPWT